MCENGLKFFGVGKKEKAILQVNCMVITGIKVISDHLEVLVATLVIDWIILLFVMFRNGLNYYTDCF